MLVISEQLIKANCYMFRSSSSRGNWFSSIPGSSTESSDGEWVDNCSGLRDTKIDPCTN